MELQVSAGWVFETRSSDDGESEVLVDWSGVEASETGAAAGPRRTLRLSETILRSGRSAAVVACDPAAPAHRAVAVPSFSLSADPLVNTAPSVTEIDVRLVTGSSSSSSSSIIIGDDRLRQQQLFALEIVCNARFIEVYIDKSPAPVYWQTIRGDAAPSDARFERLPLFSFDIALPTDVDGSRGKAPASVRLKFVSIKAIPGKSTALAVPSIRMMVSVDLSSKLTNGADDSPRSRSSVASESIAATSVPPSAQTFMQSNMPGLSGLPWQELMNSFQRSLLNQMDDKIKQALSPVMARLDAIDAHVQHLEQRVLQLELSDDNHEDAFPCPEPVE